MDRTRIIIGAAVALLVVAVVAGIAIPRGGSVGGSFPGSKRIGNMELKELASRGARLVDVRTAIEFAGRHIDGAENVPISAIASASATWDKAEPVIVYCEVGSRSANAYGYLTGRGFTHVYDLAGGIAAWDGAVAAGAASAAQGGPVTGKPTMYDFSSGS